MKYVWPPIRSGCVLMRAMSTDRCPASLEYMMYGHSRLFFLHFGRMSILTFDPKLEMSLITFMTLQMIVKWQTSVCDILPTCHDIYVEHR